LVNGWQVAGIENWSTGTPVVLNTFDKEPQQKRSSLSGRRPTWNGKSSKSGTAPFTAFDWQDFAKPAPYTIGNAPRPLSWVHNPDSQNFRLLAPPRTPGIGDRYNVQIRMEMFNALNHPYPGFSRFQISATRLSIPTATAPAATSVGFRPVRSPAHRVPGRSSWLPNSITEHCTARAILGGVAIVFCQSKWPFFLGINHPWNRKWFPQRAWHINIARGWESSS